MNKIAFDSKSWIHLLTLGVFLLLIVACMPANRPETEVMAATALPTHSPIDPTYAAQIAAMRDPGIPDLPFADNPDPGLCGIPVQWGENNQAWITGIYAGELVQDPVLLYESHLRLQITGRASHGASVQVILYQQNPVIDYYFVKLVGGDEPIEGWLPAPFLTFDSVNDST